MRVTYDPAAHAMYVYFTDTWSGRLNTLSAQIAQFDFGHDDHIISVETK